MNILFAGFRHGHIGSLYKAAKANKDIKITACFEEDENARKEYSEKFGIVFSDKSYAELISDSAVDAVAIGARYGDRGGMAIRALEKGKHVISDKPVCTSLEELKKIGGLTKAGRQKIGCMLDLRYIPSSLRAKEILASGRLGEVRNVSFSGQHCIDYNNRPSWYFEKGAHGGTINDLAVHGVDLVRELTGLKIKTIHAARCWNSYAQKTPDFLDCAIFMAELENKAGLLADVSYSAPSQVFRMPTYWNFKFWCEKGLLTYNAAESTVRVYEDGVPQVQEFDGIKSEVSCLDEFLAEVQNDTYALTGNVLYATEKCLELQAFADKKVPR
jgi:predicted dehydrogenase